MKQLVFVALLLIINTFSLHAQKPWEKIEVFRIDKVQPHSIVVPYSNEGLIDSLDFKSSAYYKALPRSKWTPTKGDTLCNKYIYTLTYPAKWINRRVFIRFDGVSTALMLYVNGRQVGYSEDSRTPAEFEITRYLTDSTANNLVVKVFKHSTGEVMECDTNSGTFSEAWLYSTPWRYISDYKVTALLDTNNYAKGELEVDVELSSEVPNDMKIEVELSHKGKSILRKQKRIKKGNWFLFMLKKELPLDSVKTWSANTPELYTMKIRLLDLNDSILEVVGTEVGFRHIAIKHHELWVNGQAEELKGVDLEGSINKQHLEIMKQLGINTIRLSQGPANEEVYHLCNQLGIYVWDMANIHDNANQSLADDKRYTDAMLYRCNNMYKRDRNHPSVVVWIAHNLKHYGYNHSETTRFISNKDNTRPVVDFNWIPLNYENLGTLDFNF